MTPIGQTREGTPEPVFYRDSMRHLVCVPYSVAGLHRMAARLGIKRCWFHGGRWPHYDIPKTLDLRGLAKLVSARDILKICKTAPKQLPLRPQPPTREEK